MCFKLLANPKQSLFHDIMMSETLAKPVINHVTTVDLATILKTYLVLYLKRKTYIMWKSSHLN
jgi:hypothetical protein